MAANAITMMATVHETWPEYEPHAIKSLSLLGKASNCMSLISPNESHTGLDKCLMRVLCGIKFKSCIVGIFITEKSTITVELNRAMLEILHPFAFIWQPLFSRRAEAPLCNSTRRSGWLEQNKDTVSPTDKSMNVPGISSVICVSALCVLVTLTRQVLRNSGSPVRMPLGHLNRLLSYTAPARQIIGLRPWHEVGRNIPPVKVCIAISSVTKICALNFFDLCGIGHVVMW